MQLIRKEMLDLHKNSFNEMTSLQQPSSSRTSISTSGFKRSHNHDISEDSGDEWPMSKHSRIMPTERDVIDKIDDLLGDQKSLQSARHVQESDNTGIVNVHNDEMEDDIVIEDRRKPEET
ncbi:hypothetical protein LOTGIDRAFT_175579 [Lottia gigantea]|uniref:Uncharacterized protein n=1 Tax=Lottia gigantea TaxID=225164 RepID=V4ADJ2_LOTGI|nr:hypothetical protein LOTGIDRAFT_175579 [Lottia gigantea]ESO93195.1 hypothetical protein LOTGIDRAFT_175579 [Lottia gigantea]